MWEWGGRDREGEAEGGTERGEEREIEREGGKGRHLIHRPPRLASSHFIEKLSK